MNITGQDILIVALLVIILVFEILMFISVATNKNISDKAKMWWIVGMVLVHPIVAIFYYFTDHRKRNLSPPRES